MGKSRFAEEQIAYVVAADGAGTKVADLTLDKHILQEGKVLQNGSEGVTPQGNRLLDPRRVGWYR